MTPFETPVDGTPFVESFATQQLLPPWSARDAQTWLFVVEFDEGLEARLATYLDTFFNAGLGDDAGFRYAPAKGSRFGLLTVSSCPPSTDPAALAKAQGWDHVEHDDIFLSFPVLRQPIGGADDDGAPIWIQPFMCSNSSTVVFSAREIWGCDMTYAETYLKVSRPASGAPPDMHLDAVYLGPRSFEVRAKSERLPLLHVDTHGRRDAGGINRHLDERPGLRAFFETLGKSGLVEAGWQTAPKTGQGRRNRAAGFVGGEIGFDLNNLKQIRDAFDLDRALYRAIIATRSHYDDMRDFEFLDDTKVELAFVQSVTMTELLVDILGAPKEIDRNAPGVHVDDPGVATNGRGGRRPHTHLGIADADWRRLPAFPLTTVLAFTFKSNIRFEVTDTIYTYGPKHP